MLAPQSGQTRLRIAEIKLVSMFLATVYEAIMSLPVVAIFTDECTTLSVGPQERFEAGAQWIRAAAPGVRYRHKEQLSRQTPCGGERQSGIRRRRLLRSNRVVAQDSPIPDSAEKLVAREVIRSA